MSKTYSAHGLAGCVQQRRCRATGLYVSIYHATQAGIATDPEHPWATVCQTHCQIAVHNTLALARRHSALPDWCTECAQTLRSRP
jgi:hypothetical protein